jgi:phosphatidylglycerol---prolipoprotein diacylglyceryl transferase
MRPRIVHALDLATGVSVFDWLVPSPAFMYALAMMVALVVVYRRSRTVGGVHPYHALGVVLWTMVGALVGARAFYLLQHLSETLADPRTIFEVGGATASWGAFGGGVAGLLAYCRRHRLEMARYADLIAPAAGLAIAIGRLACFLNGDDFGTPSELPWAVRFPHGSYPFAHHVQAGLLSPLDELSLPVHPVQLYLSLAGLGLFFLVTRCWRRHRELPGATALFFWLGYCASRFPLELFRGDHDHVLMGLPSSQSLALATGLAAGLGLWSVWASRAGGAGIQEGASSEALGGQQRLPDA